MEGSGFGDEGHVSSPSRQPRRRKVKTKRTEPSEKERVKEQRPSRSGASRKRRPWLQDVAHAPTYRPTAEEFKDPLSFLRRIEPEAAKHGICKIVAPAEFRERVNELPTVLTDFVFTAREQKLREHLWDNFGKTEIIYEHAQPFTVREFQRTVNESAAKMLRDSHLLPAAYIESEFWRLRNSQDATDVYILYGNDVEGTACDRNNAQSIGCTEWNLQDLGKASWSMLRHAPIDYPGITTPMLYIGSLFSTFFWHVEDHWMHSINYSHYGATKTWYGVPSSHADAFERVVVEKVYRRAVRAKKAEGKDVQFIQKAALKQLLAKTTLFLPKLLVEAGIPVFRLDQEPGDFILTMPRAYHAGFSHGFNIGEAVNFALPEWLPAGEASLERYAFLGMPQILPHQLLLVKETAALFDELQRTKQQPTSIEQKTIRQFCRFALQQAQLREELVHEKGLEEVWTSDALKSQICFMCFRHICGAFVFYSATGAPRCMQCSIRAPHITHPDWKLAVPEVVRMIGYLESQLWVHYRLKAPDHPLEWKIPKKTRSRTQHRPRCLLNSDTKSDINNNNKRKAMESSDATTTTPLMAPPESSVV